MCFAERIQVLRKQKGLSQEQLAEALSVSRQAVSKWESDQSLPEIEKIILMSELFEVSTDYLLKGVETDQNATEELVPGDYSAGATALIAIGLIIAICGWDATQTAASIGGGMIIQVVGIAGLLMGRFRSVAAFKERKNAAIIIINIWLLLFMPVSILSCVIFRYPASPYPHDIRIWALFLCVYMASGLAGTAFILKASKKMA